MAESILEISEKLLKGETTIEEHHPFIPSGEMVEVGEGSAFLASMANVCAFDTGDGLFLVDTGSMFTAKLVFDKVRAWSKERLNTAVYSHGHVDHVFGVPPFEEEAAGQGWAAPRVVAHEAMPARFDRYILTAGYNGIINQRQFSVPGLQWPTEYRYPDETYRDVLTLEVGGERFELHHARGETDDHTWTWLPERKILCPGDFFIWASPNAGNPQKVQRYPKEWADAMREMAKLGAEVMLPGHGLPIAGADAVRQALLDTAELLDSVHDQALAMMNEGARLNDIIHSVKLPAALLEKPYLRPIYDDPEYIIRNVWRLYGGWYDGNPANLKPSPDSVLAAEIAALAGGAGRLAARALEIADEGDLRLAGHLAELAVQAAPDDKQAHVARADVCRRRVAAESALMSKGIFSWAAAESERAKGELGG